MLRKGKFKEFMKILKKLHYLVDIPAERDLTENEFWSSLTSPLEGAGYPTQFHCGGATVFYFTTSMGQFFEKEIQELKLEDQFPSKYSLEFEIEPSPICFLSATTSEQGMNR
jgi:hypothetical protein